MGKISKAEYSRRAKKAALTKARNKISRRNFHKDFAELSVTRKKDVNLELKKGKEKKKKSSPLKGQRSGKSRKIAYEHYRPICVWCGLAIEDVLEVAHIDHNRGNDDIDNLVFLCRTHHRMLDLGMIPENIIVQLRDRDFEADWSVLIKGKRSKVAKKTQTIEKEAEKMNLLIRKRRETALKAWNTRRKNQASNLSTIRKESDVDELFTKRREAALKAWETRRRMKKSKRTR